MQTMNRYEQMREQTNQQRKKVNGPSPKGPQAGNVSPPTPPAATMAGALSGALSGGARPDPNQQLSKYRPQQPMFSTGTPAGSPQAIPQATTRPAVIAGTSPQAQQPQQPQQQAIPTMNPPASVVGGGNTMHQKFIQEALNQGFSPEMIMQFLTQKLGLGQG